MFTLPFNIPVSDKKVRLKDQVFSIGSCFSTNIGKKLSLYKFDATTNPLGIIYNPYSIFKNLRLLLSDGLDPENYVKNGDVFYHWDAHSEISSTDLGTFKKKIQEQSLKAKQSLIGAKWLLITLGTSKAYRHLEMNKIVANCHKTPHKEFEVVNLGVEEIAEDFNHTIELIRAINSDIEVVITVSPVRHFRDGLIENNLNKATLLHSVNKILKTHNNVAYFPSYEIMIDELRDYRFYDNDMVHPNALGIDYVWKRFTDTYMSDSAKLFMRDWDQILKSLQHRPFHPGTEAHQKFLKKLEQQLLKLESQVDVNQELMEIRKQIPS